MEAAGGRAAEKPTKRLGEACGGNQREDERREGIITELDTLTKNHTLSRVEIMDITIMVVMMMMMMMMTTERCTMIRKQRIK